MIFNIDKKLIETDVYFLQTRRVSRPRGMHRDALRPAAQEMHGKEGPGNAWKRTTYIQDYDEEKLDR